MINKKPVDFAPEKLDELRGHMEKVSGRLGAEVLPPSLGEDILEMPIGEIRENYRSRYSAFVNALHYLNDRGRADFNPVEAGRMVGALNNLDQYLTVNELVPAKMTLRPSQFEAFKKLRDFLESGGKHGYFKLPTSYGKTVLFTEFIEALGLKTLVVVPTIVLVGQTEEKFKKFAADLDVGLIYGYAKSRGHKVTITTYYSFLSQVGRGLLKPEDFDCLILDEAHHALSERMVRLLDKFNHAIKLGFTATPYFHEEKQLSKILPTEIDKLTTPEAIREGLLCPVRNVIARTDIDLGDLALNPQGEYSEAELADKINVKGRNEAVVALYRKMFDGKMGVAYCAGVKHAQDLAGEFKSAGIPAAYIASTLKRKEKEALLRDHHDGKIKMLCNADMLVEGYDEPKVEVCLNVAPTFSYVRQEQRSGRCTRLDPENFDKFAAVVDFVDMQKANFINNVTYAEIMEAAVALKKGQEFKDTYGGADVLIRNLTVVTSPEKIMGIVARQKEDRIVKSEEGEVLEAGWLKIADVCDRAGVSEALAKRVAEGMMLTSPELFLTKEVRKRFFSKQAGNKTKIYYRPEVADKIRAEVEMHRPPKGWMSKVQICKEHHLRPEDLVDFTRRNAEKWLGRFLSPQGTWRIYYDPALVPELKRSFLKVVPGKGFIEENELAGRLRVSVYKIKKVAESLCPPDRKWIIKYEHCYRDPKPLFFYHPALVEKITDLIYGDEKNYYRVDSLKAILELSDKKYDALISRGMIEKYIVVHQKRKLINVNDIPEIMEIMIPQFVKWESSDELKQRIMVTEPYLRALIRKFEDKKMRNVLYKIDPQSDKINTYLSPALTPRLEAEVNEYKPKEGWLPSRAMASRLGISQVYIRLFIQNLRERGEKIETCKALDFDGRTKLHYSPKVYKKVRAAAGETNSWHRLTDLAPILDEPLTRVRGAVVAMNRKKLWDPKFCVLGNKEGMLVSPLLVPMLKNVLGPVKGWKSMAEIMRASRLDFTFVRFFMREVRRKDPSSMRRAPDENGRWKYYCGPAAIRAFNGKIKEIMGWKNLYKLAAELPVGATQLGTLFETCRKDNYLEGCEIKLRAGVVERRVSPQMEARIRELAAIPEGFMCVSSLARSLGIEVADVHSELDPMMAERPDQLKMCWEIGRGQPQMFVGPALVDHLRKICLPQAPEGWLTLDEIAGELKHSCDEISELIGTLYGQVIADEAAQYISRNGCCRLHYSPHICSMLRARNLPPEGWMDFPQLAELIGVSPVRIKSAAESLSIGKTGWMARFFNVDRRCESTFLHPELIVLITRKLE